MFPPMDGKGEESAIHFSPALHFSSPGPSSSRHQVLLVCRILAWSSDLSLPNPAHLSDHHWEPLFPLPLSFSLLSASGPICPHLSSSLSSPRE